MEKVTIYTRVAVYPNPGKGVGGAVIVDEEGDTEEYTVMLGDDVTSNAAEIIAVNTILSMFDEPTKITIVTCNKLFADCVNGKMQASSNLHLFDAFHDISKDHQVSVMWSKANSSDSSYRAGRLAIERLNNL